MLRWLLETVAATTTTITTTTTILCPSPCTVSGTTRVSRYQKGKIKTNLDLLEQDTVSGSGISWAICKSAPRHRQVTIPAPHHSFFTGRMPFLPPNQHCQSTEGNKVATLATLLPSVLRSLKIIDDDNDTYCFSSVSVCVIIIILSIDRAVQNGNLWFVSRLASSRFNWYNSCMFFCLALLCTFKPVMGKIGYLLIN